MHTFTDTYVRANTDAHSKYARTYTFTNIHTHIQKYAQTDIYRYARTDSLIHMHSHSHTCPNMHTYAFTCSLKIA